MKNRLWKCEIILVAILMTTFIAAKAMATTTVIVATDRTDAVYAKNDPIKFNYKSSFTLIATLAIQN
jgi:hypothetical protein